MGKEDWKTIPIKESVQTGELLFDMGPVVLARRMDKGSNRCTKAHKASAGIPEGFGAVQERKKIL